MDRKYILYVLGQLYGIEKKFCGKGVLKTRKNGHFGPFLSFLRLLRSFRRPKPIYCYFLFLYLFILLRIIIADHLKQFLAFEAI